MALSNRDSVILFAIFPLHYQPQPWRLGSPVLVGIRSREGPPELTRRFSNFLMKNASGKSFPRGNFGRQTGLPSTWNKTKPKKRNINKQQKTQKGTAWKNSQEKNPRFSQIPEGHLGAFLTDIMVKRNRKNSPRKATGLPRKQKRLRNHLKKTAMAVARLLQRQHLSQRLWSLGRFLLLELVENTKLADQIFKQSSDYIFKKGIRS